MTRVLAAVVAAMMSLAACSGTDPADEPTVVEQPTEASAEASTEASTGASEASEVSDPCSRMVEDEAAADASSPEEVVAGAGDVQEVGWGEEGRTSAGVMIELDAPEVLAYRYAEATLYTRGGGTRDVDLDALGLNDCVHVLELIVSNEGADSVTLEPDWFTAWRGGQPLVMVESRPYGIVLPGGGMATYLQPGDSLQMEIAFVAPAEGEFRVDVEPEDGSHVVFGGEVAPVGDVPEQEEPTLLDYYADANADQGMSACPSEVTVTGAQELTWSNAGVVMVDGIVPAYPVVYESASSLDGLTVNILKTETMEGEFLYNVNVKSSPGGTFQWVSESVTSPSALGSFDDEGSGASFADLRVPSTTGDPDLIVSAEWAC